MPTASVYDIARATELSKAWADRARNRSIELLQNMKPVEVALVDNPPVMAIRGNLIALLEAGKIPDSLTPFAWDMIQSGREKSVQETEAAIVSRWQEWLQTLDTVFLANVIFPHFVVPDPIPDGEDEHPPQHLGEDQLSYLEVTLQDKIAFFNWCQGVSDHLASFRSGQGAAVRPMDASQSVSEVYASGTFRDPSLPGATTVVANQSSDDGMGQDSRPAAGGSSRGRRQQAKEG